MSPGPSLLRKCFGEALGTAFLLMAVVGSGIMAERLAGGNVALALWANTAATAAALVVLILVFGPVSGAQLNPAVTLVACLRGEIGVRAALAYGAAQIAGAAAGVLVAHLMFELPLVSAFSTPRTGFGSWLGEAVATFGLVGTILSVARTRPGAVPMAVGLYIASAYWFTSSTAFANPAVTLARALTSSFAGIRWADVPAFALAQIAGALAASVVFGWLSAPARARKAHAEDARRHDLPQPEMLDIAQGP